MLRLEKDIKQHPGGFSYYPEICYCHDAYFTKRDGSAAPDSEFYSTDVQENIITNENSDPLFIEYVYILDCEAQMLHVLTHIPAMCNPKWESPDGRVVFSTSRLIDGSTVVDYGHCAYSHAHVVSFPVEGPEPDWTQVEGQANQVYDKASQEAGE